MPLTLNLGPSFDITEGASLAITTSLIDASPAADGLIFTVSGVTQGVFKLSGSTTTTFTLGDIKNNLVTFVHDGGELAPVFSISVTDGTDTIAPAAATITFTAVDDAPVLTLGNFSVTEGGTLAITSAEISVTDPDTAAASLVITPSSILGGVFKVSGTTASSFTMADITANRVTFVHDGSETPAAFSIKVSDGHSDSDVKAAAITYSPVNDNSPVIVQNSNIAITEGGTSTITVDNLNVTDLDLDAPETQIFALSSLGSIQNITFKKDGVVITPVANDLKLFTLKDLIGDGNGSKITVTHNGGESTPSLFLTVNNAVTNANGTVTSRPSASKQIFFNYTSVNDTSPVLSLGLIAAVKGVPFVLKTDFFSATDGDTQTQSADLTFRISNTSAGRFVKDGSTTVINFTKKDVEDGKITFVDDGSGNAPSFSVNVFDGINSSATQNIGITLSANSNSPAIAFGTINVTENQSVTLNTRHLNATSNLTIDASVKTITKANITLSGFQSINGYTLVDGDHILVKDQTDPTQNGIYLARSGAWELATDSTTSISLTNKVVLVQNGDNKDEILILTGTVGTELSSRPALTFTVTDVIGGDFMKSNGATTPVLTKVTSFSLEDIKDGLISFKHDSSESTPSFKIQVGDGNGHDSLVVAPNISYTSSNDQVPVLTLGAISVGEAASVTITTAMINATDADLPTVADSSLTFTVSEVTGGSFKKAGNTVPSFTLAEIKAGSISFTHDGSESTPGFKITVRDGNAGASTTLTSSSQTGSISITPINDAPTLTLGAIPVLKGTPLIIKVEHINAADVDANTADSELTFTVSVKGGAFKLKSVVDSVISYSSVTSFTLEQVKAGSISFADDGTGNGSFTIKVTDNGTAGVDKLSSAEQNGTINVSTGSDLPALALGSFAISEGGSLTLSTAILNAIAKSGSADNLLIIKASEVKGGSFVKDGTYISDFTLQDVKDGKVSFFHDGSEVTAAFKLSLTEGANTTVAQTANINYTAVNDITPTLVLGGADKFLLSESGTGATLLITTAMINAIDLDSTSTDATLTFTITTPAGGSFSKKSGTSSSTITTFTLKDIKDGNISFVADGSETQPAFTIKVSDSLKISDPQTAAFTFTKVNDAPVLVLGTFPVAKGVPLKITTSIFNATDAEGAADADLKFIIAGLNSGSFRKTGVSDAISEFTLADIKADKITFVEGGKKPIFSIKVSDGAAVNPESAAKIVEASYSTSSAPAMSLGAFAISEGGTLAITTSLINAAASVDDTAINFYVNSVSGGSFNLKSGSTNNLARSFTLKDIKDGNVSFIHDGNEAAPKFSLKVSDGSHVSPVQNGVITYTAVNDNAPIIATIGNFKITEGTSTTSQYIRIDQKLLKATDADLSTLNTALIFNVSAVTGGSFVRLTDLKGNYAPVTSFSQAEILAKKIFFLQNGQSVVPTFNVAVTDGSRTSTTHSIRFEFKDVNDTPVTTLSDWGMNANSSLVLKKTHLTIKDEEISDSTKLSFTVSSVTGGHFTKTVSSTATTVKTFTLKDVEDGAVRFVHDGPSNGASKASFTLKGSDGELSSSASQAILFGIGDGAKVSGSKTDETFVVTSKTFASIKGGAGNDTIWFGSGVTGSVDLTTIDNSKITDIEAIDLNSAAITLKLNLDEVKALSSSSDLVRIHGEAGNTVIISDLNTWSKGANVTGSTGIEYYHYTNGDATLDIQKDITVNAAPTFTLKTWDLAFNGNFALTTDLLTIADIDTLQSANLTVTASAVTGGSFQKSSVDVTSFTRADLENGLISFRQDGTDKVTYSLKVTDDTGLISSTITRTYEFNVGTGDTGTGTADANTFVITDKLFTKIDGLAGNDTVRFGTGLTGLFDLTTLADTLFKDVEIFELAGTTSTLKLNVAEVKALSTTTDLLTVRGSSVDKIQIDDFSIWSHGSDVTLESILYSTYSNAGATLRIQKDISII